MKKITYILLMALPLFVFNSCSKNVNETKDINYVSFEKLSYNFNVMPDTTMKYNINFYTTQISGSDRTFNIAVDDQSTSDPTSYSVPTSVTVPANSNHGVLAIGLLDKNISASGNTLILKFAQKDGLFTGHSTAISINEFCPLNNNPGDFAGTWSANDFGYTENVTMTVNGDSLTVSGLSVGMITDWWGETITSGGTFSMKVTDNSEVFIPRQFMYTTLYNGAPSSYDIKGSGTWKNCGTPTIEITYDVYYAGDATGIGADYNGAPFTATLTLGGPIVNKISNFNHPKAKRHR
jgi:hypothetical protein